MSLVLFGVTHKSEAGWPAKRQKKVAFAWELYDPRLLVNHAGFTGGSRSATLSRGGCIRTRSPQTVRRPASWAVPDPQGGQQGANRGKGGAGETLPDCPRNGACPVLSCSDGSLELAILLRELCGTLEASRQPSTCAAFLQTDASLFCESVKAPSAAPSDLARPLATWHAPSAPGASAEMNPGEPHAALALVERPLHILSVLQPRATSSLPAMR